MCRRFLILISLTCLVEPLWGLSGFYVTRSGTVLKNNTSRIIYARKGKQNTLTLYSDLKGDVNEFAMVVPVPEVVKKDQVRVAERDLIEKIDAFSAARLTEHFDPDPCQTKLHYSVEKEVLKKEKSQGVELKAQFSVGEYDIALLSAKQSWGLVKWLEKFEYKLPQGAEVAIKEYIRKGMYFFVARVNLRQHSSLGYRYLRPLQVRYTSSRFRIPIKLGRLNAKGAQELVVYFLTSKGRVEASNHPMAEMPTDHELPPFVKYRFDEFYQSVFKRAYRREKRGTVFLEHAWDVRKCFPCVVEPFTRAQMEALGVDWVGDDFASADEPPVFLTRLRVRYSDLKEDLKFKEVEDRTFFQGLYSIRFPAIGKRGCAQAVDYQTDLSERKKQETQNLIKLTGWSRKDIQAASGASSENSSTKKKWYERVFDEESE